MLSMQWLAGPDRPMRARVGALAVGAVVLVFLLDTWLPPGIVVPLLYAPVLVVALAVRNPRFALWVAAAATALTVLDLAIATDGVSWPTDVVNRVLALLLIWITAGGVTNYSLTADRRRDSSRALEDIKQALDQAAIVAITDVPGRITFVNDKFCEISGYTREELIGQDHRLLNSGWHSPEFIRTLWRTIAQGQVWRGEIRNRAKDGSYYWVDTTIVPFLNARGKPWQYMAIRYDITERKAQEQQLRDQAALAALGEFAAVVAHEVRNPLAGIRNGVQLIASELPRTSDVSTLGDDIVDRIDALNAVIEDLLTFARPRELRVSPISLLFFISDIISGFRHDPAMTNTHVDLEGDAQLVIDADSDQLRLVFSNLLLNAGQAMQGSGTIVVKVEADAEHCVIAIADQGPGIPAELQERVFEPFFTTKHRGTGLGLPTVKRVVQAHHGRVSVRDRPGGGAVVRVELPIHQPRPASSPSSSSDLAADPSATRAE